MTSNFPLTTATTTKQIEGVNRGSYGQPLSADGATEKETPFQLYLSVSQNRGTLCEQCQTVHPGKAEGIAFLSQLFREATNSEADPGDPASDPAAVLIAFLLPFAPAGQIQISPDNAGNGVFAGDPASTFPQVPVLEDAAVSAQGGTTTQGLDLPGDIDAVQEEQGDFRFLKTPSDGQSVKANPAYAEELVLQNKGTLDAGSHGDGVAHAAAADLLDAGQGTNAHMQVFPLHPHAEPVGTSQSQGPGESGAVRQTVPAAELTGLHRPILRAIAAGEKQLIIEIRPPDLGTLQIRLTSDRGIISADITVDNQAARDMLSVALPQIRNSMEEAGISLREFSVDLRRDPDPQDHRREQQAEQGRKGKEQREGGENFLNLFA